MPVTRLRLQRGLPARSSLSPGSRASGEAHTAVFAPLVYFSVVSQLGDTVGVRSGCWHGQVRVLSQVTPFLLCAPGAEGERELSGGALWGLL